MNKHYITCVDSVGTHKMVYTQWGEEDNPNVLICVHGLTRNGRDFDFLARELAKDYCIICPDVVGRGESDYLTEPKDYNLMVYAKDILTLLHHLNLSKVDWLGTSMGGLIGMAIASQPESLIRRLILNDVGPFIPQGAMQRIGGYLLKEQPTFIDLNIAQEYMRSKYQPFGNLTDEQWQHLTQYSVKSLPEGGYTLNYDPQISFPYQNTPLESLKAQEFWQWWEGISCPILLLHGQESDLLLPDTISQMKEIHPDMTVVSFPDVGHAPALMNDEQIQIIKNWLAETKS
ncbi:alpha/beta hydrolase fold protein [Gloeothece citriformis PCC 7424]|uniref:Alpha/beta hydrolase fold protein n=1 Tax=Gloeothece citriformis (strain PCC 7424) TaxID=65393 RepID=B7KFB2_GLOC7|nr:alpha/beta hydrolase [Gloeothece citriformis]ACK71828.1 alpha/beta hydrolase fold protein [Gloeothece citriformis PCC 7424]